MAGRRNGLRKRRGVTEKGIGIVRGNAKGNVKRIAIAKEQLSARASYRSIPIRTHTTQFLISTLPIRMGCIPSRILIRNNTQRTSIRIPTTIMYMCTITTTRVQERARVQTLRHRLRHPPDARQTYHSLQMCI